MVCVGGADKGVRLNIQERPGLLKKSADAVCILLGWYTCCRRSLGDLIPMFIRPGLKTDILLAEPAETAVGVSHNGRIRMTKVRLGVNIVYGCSNVEAHLSFATARVAACH